MLIKMSDRGPDSAGLALYPRKTRFDMKFTLRLENCALAKEIELVLKNELKEDLLVEFRGSHLVLQFDENIRLIDAKYLNQERAKDLIKLS